MDYEKKYNEMVRRAKELYESGNALTRQQMEIVCPELTESEDERIRKEIIDYIKSGEPQMCYDKRWIAYLEKQKEQKPAEWSEEDERIRLACIATINDVIDYERDRWEDYNPGKPYRPITKYDEQIDWLKSLRPSWKPSEEQLEVLLNAEDLVRANNYPENAKILASLYKQLKKLM